MAKEGQITLPINRYNKLRDVLDQLELSEAKSRMASEEANERIEQLEEILHAIHDFASQYAAFNPAMEKVQKMAKECEQNAI